jgi:hypothetical protein
MLKSNTSITGELPVVGGFENSEEQREALPQQSSRPVGAQRKSHRWVQAKNIARLALYCQQRGRIAHVLPAHPLKWTGETAACRQAMHGCIDSQIAGLFRSGSLIDGASMAQKQRPVPVETLAGNTEMTKSTDHVLLIETPTGAAIRRMGRLLIGPDAGTRLYSSTPQNPWQHCAFGMDGCVFALLGSC